MHPTLSRTLLAMLSSPGIGALAACSTRPSIPTPLPAPALPPRQTSTETPTSRPSATPTLTATASPSALPSPTPDRCDVSITPLALIDNDTYFAWGPTSNQMDEAVLTRHPQWASFRQVVFDEPWTVGDVYRQAAFCGEGCGVNSAILLIGLSMRLHWEIPRNGDLFLRAQQAAREFYQYYLLYILDESVRAAYPGIGNAATYSLYRFFGRDLNVVREWCILYQRMFGDQYPLTP